MPPAVNPDDHAVVIAIRRYADAAAGWITSLEGPDNDATAVADWLRREDGGGLPDENIHVVSAAGVPDPFPDGRATPDQQGVVAALDAIATLPKGGFDGQFAGRRLYVYVSGHGFAREPDEAAVITAEATKANTVNVLVTSWARWMHKAAPFKELVLWVDTCATSAPIADLHGCGLPLSMSRNHPDVRVFEGFAAPLGLAAVENQMPDGRWHGVFTWALLTGLNGAAPSPVSSNSLRDYLYNAMSAFMRDDQRSRKSVAKAPSFGRTDPIVFTSRAPSAHPVTLRFPPECVGRRVFVGVNRSDPPVAETVLDGVDWTPRLKAGFWGVFVDGTDTLKLFEVAGGGVDGTVVVA